MGVVGVVGVGVGVGVLSSSFDTAGSSVSPALSCIICALPAFDFTQTRTRKFKFV